MIRIPNPTWAQANNSDKFGTISASRCLNLDQEGYIKLAPRTLSVFSEDTSIPAFDTNLGQVLSIGRYGLGDFTAITTNANVNLEVSNTTIDGIEDEETGNPSPTLGSWGTFWQNRWYVSTDTTVIYKAIASGAAGAWTTGIITSLTTGVTHALEVFRNKNALAVTDANTVKLYNTSHTNTVTLTLPADFEAIGVSYSNLKMGVITRLASTLEGQGSDAYFFVWDGSSAQAGPGIPIGSDAAVAITAYKGTWVILTRTGQLLIYNGGGFQELAAFPFYYSPYQWGDFINKVANGNIMWTEGDLIYINIDCGLDQYGHYLESYLPYTPSGTWCFDPKAGLYHKYAPSLSYMNTLTVLSSGVDTSTDTLTIDSGTVPTTGSIVRYVDGNGTPIGGLKEYFDYYVIKTGASTFRLAETYDEAIAGAYLDITSTGAATNRFLSIQMLDFNAVDVSTAGAITGVGSYDMWGEGVIIGADVYDHDSTSAFNHLMLTVPNVENRGYFVTPKVYAQARTDTYRDLTIRFKPLAAQDAIIVKEKTRDLAGLPTSTRRATSGITWTGSDTFYTSADISDVYTAFNNGNAIEVELLSGCSAGAMEQVLSIDYSNSVYTITLAHDVPFAAGGKVSQAQFDNWRVISTLTNTSSENSDGVATIPVGSTSKWSMYKVELRGVNVTIEDFSIDNVPHKL